MESSQDNVWLTNETSVCQSVRIFPIEVTKRKYSISHILNTSTIILCVIASRNLRGLEILAAKIWLEFGYFNTFFFHLYNQALTGFSCLILCRLKAIRVHQIDPGCLQNVFSIKSTKNFFEIFAFFFRIKSKNIVC
jgi:hypothetical protein